MAAKTHVQDSAVAERRLRPIYEWLDSGNSKKALQEAEKVLRKTPNLQCAKALKALSLLQLGRESECLAILKALTAETPCDNSTLQAMTVCYRDLQQLDQVCNLYKAAVEADPTNEELHTHLFMSYVRTSDFKQQQQAAMALYKLKPKNPYYFWAVMSVVLQATRGPGAQDPDKRKLLLCLAERMVDKLVSEGRLEAEQEVQLYLMILELQEKYEEALTVLDGPLAAKLIHGRNDQMRIPILIKLGRWRELNLLCKELLTAAADRWDLWQHYLTSMFELQKLGSETMNNHKSEILENHNEDTSQPNSLEILPDDSPEKAHEFICSLMENLDNLFTSSVSYQLRGPYLARLELCKRLTEQGFQTRHILGDTFELLVEYFRVFGHKPCCVSDLKIYLHLLESHRRKELASRLLKDVGISSTTIPQSEKQMQKHICSLQLSRMCGSHQELDSEYLGAFVTALSLHYQNGAQTFGLERLPTDQGPADPYALLAVHVLYDQACQLEQSGPLLTAIALLESLLTRSPSNFHAKLLLIRLYHLLGGGDGAHRAYESLDAKHLQLDSLGFAHCARIHTTGLATLLTTHYDTLKFFTTNYRDSIDHLTFSYKFGSFLKLEEFMDFRERLNNSLHYTMTAVDRMILEMILCTTVKGLHNIEASPKNNNINWDALRDNNDYGVYLSWDPDRVNSALDQCQYIKNLFQQEREVARIRATIVWGMSSAADILKSTEDNKEQCFKTLSDVIRNFETVFENINNRSDLKQLVHNQISLPLPSRLQTHLVVPYREILGSMFKIVHAVTTGIRDGLDKTLESTNKVFTKLTQDFNEMVLKSNELEDNLWRKYSRMEYAVNVVEVLSLSTLLCAVCAEFTKPAQQRKGKKNKYPTDNAMRDTLTVFMTDLRECLVSADRTLGSWQGPKHPSGLCERLSTLAIGDSDFNSVLEHLNTSHSNAVKELRNILNCKIKYLNQLIC